MIEPGDAFVHLNDKASDRQLSICLSIKTQKNIEGDEHYVITCLNTLKSDITVFKISAYDLLCMIHRMTFLKEQA